MKTGTTSRHAALFGAGTAAVCLGAGAAHADIITFDDLAHGEIVSGQLTSSLGVTVSAVNPNRRHDLAIIFDSLETNTEDPDLEGPAWARGNLAPGTVLGNMLIIAENDVDRNDDGLIDRPDDEGRRPAGSLIFDFAAALDAFSLDLVDVEGANEESGSLDFYVDGDLRATVAFAEFVDPHSLFYDATVIFGDNSANRLPTIHAADLGLDLFDRVSVNLGGSGAIDNLMYSTVPSPGAVALLLGSILAGRGRRRRTS